MKELAFWDMPWGGANYHPAAEKLVKSYSPANGLPSFTYQALPWNNFYQTFAAAISSGTGPAVSTGGGYQAFQFAGEGAIAYADNVIETLKGNGLYDDFLPGLFDAMKTPDGYAAIPWQIDARALWYRKSLLQQAGVEPPKDWDSLLAAGKALAKMGVSGFGLAAGASSNHGAQAMLSMLINNGGGLFDENQQPNVVTDRNIETVDFLKELAVAGVMQPAAIGYSTENLASQWKEKKIGMGISEAGWNGSIGDTEGDMAVTDPIVGPHGDKGFLFYINNIMMYKGSPSQEGSEAFLVWYLQNMHTYWDQKVVSGLPVLKSTTDTETFRSDPTNVKIVNEWVPVGKTFSTLSTGTWPAVAAVEASTAFHEFAQVVIQGKEDSRTILTNLQNGLVEAAKS